MHDLVIRNGTVIDGTGQSGFTADIAISGERITAVGDVSDAAYQTIDATDKLVTPGFIDTHTHMDAQFHVGPARHTDVLARHHNPDPRELRCEFRTCQANRSDGFSEGS